MRLPTGWIFSAVWQIRNESGDSPRESDETLTDSYEQSTPLSSAARHTPALQIRVVKGCVLSGEFLAQHGGVAGVGEAGFEVDYAVAD